MMVDEDKLGELRAVLCDRFTPDELIELLGVSTAEVFDRFSDECMELDLDEVL